MIYTFFKGVVQLLTRLFYKSIHINGLENVPKDKPLLIAMNHPAGFMEPIILASTFPRKLYFLVRGDIFKKQWLRPILEATNQLPIYRFKDGYANLKKNQSVLNAVNNKLHNAKPILIYVEGSTKAVMQLRPLQKGMARMAFEALESKNELDLQILPVGINFTDPTKLYSEVMLNIGEAFPVSKYSPQFKSHPNKGYSALTKATKESLRKLVLHVEDLEEMPLFEDTLTLHRSTLPHQYLPRVRMTSERYQGEKKIVDGVNELTDEKKEQLKLDIHQLKTALKKDQAQLSDLQKSSKSISTLLILILGLPFALVGFIINIPFLYLSKSIAEKKVKEGAFRISVMGAVAVIAGLIYYAIILIVSLSLFSWKGGIAAIAFLLLGCFAHYCFYLQSKLKKANKFNQLDKAHLLERDRILQNFH